MIFFPTSLYDWGLFISNRGRFHYKWIWGICYRYCFCILCIDGKYYTLLLKVCKLYLYMYLWQNVIYYVILKLEEIYLSYLYSKDISSFSLFIYMENEHVQALLSRKLLLLYTWYALRYTMIFYFTFCLQTWSRSQGPFLA